MLINRPKRQRLFVVAVAAAVVAVFEPNPETASATTNITNIGSSSAEVTVDGRTLVVHDNHADGHSVVGLYKVNHAATWTQVWVATGAGTSSDPVALPAGASITISACLGEAGYPNQVIWDSCRGKQTTVVTPAAAVSGATVGRRRSAPAEPQDQVSPLATSLKVMSWNVEGTNADASDVAGWATTIRQHNPVIVAIQESCRQVTDDLVGQLGGAFQVRHAIARPNPACGLDPGFGNAMLVRSDYAIQNPGDLMYIRQGNEVQRIVQWVGLVLPGDSAATFFYNTHLEQSDRAIADYQIEQLVKVVTVHPRTAVLGDLNTNPTNTSSMAMLHDNGLRDVDRDCHRFNNDGCTATKHAKIDWILFRLMREQTREQVPPTPYSDHRPLISTLVTYDGWNAGGTVSNWGSDVARTTFAPTTRELVVDDVNENGLSAVGVYWLKVNGAWTWTPNQVLWNPHGVGGGTARRPLPLAVGEQVIYASCSGYFGGADGPQRLFWDSCGDQRLATAA